MEIQSDFAWIIFIMVAGYGCIIGAFSVGLIRVTRQKRTQTFQSDSFVSVIIPVRNEERNILPVLEEIYSQDFPRDRMEVIVSDDYSEDGTMAIANRFAALHPDLGLVMICPPTSGIKAPGKKRAIERAVRKAKGDILLLSDADTSRGPGWITSMVSGFGTPEIRMVLGPVRFCHEKNLLQKIQSLEFLGLVGVTAGSAGLGYPVMCNGANLAYRHSAFLQTGGFDGNRMYQSGDDQFMMSSIRKHYGKRSVVFNADPLSVVSTEPERTLKGFLNQRIRWVSKSPGYRDPAVIVTGLVTFSTHLLLLAGMLTGIFWSKLLTVSILLWFLKILLEYPMVWIMTRFFGKKRLTGYYFIAQVFQLVYVPLTGFLGLFIPYRWKGRKG